MPWRSTGSRCTRSWCTPRWCSARWPPWRRSPTSRSRSWRVTGCAGRCWSLVLDRPRVDLARPTSPATTSSPPAGSPSWRAASDRIQTHQELRAGQLLLGRPPASRSSRVAGRSGCTPAPEPCACVLGVLLGVVGAVAHARAGRCSPATPAPGPSGAPEPAQYAGSLRRARAAGGTTRPAPGRPGRPRPPRRARTRARPRRACSRAGSPRSSRRGRGTPRSGPRAARARARTTGCPGCR